MKRTLLSLIVTAALFFGMAGAQPTLALSAVTLTASGWSADVGTWDAGTGVAILNQDVASLTIAPNIAPSVTVEGNSHLVTGSGSGYGVNITGWTTGTLTVKNLVVSRFTYGVWLSGSSGVTLQGISASGCSYGIYVYSGGSNTLASNTAGSNTFDGIRLQSSNYNALNDNALDSNGQCGLYINNSTQNKLARNKMGEVGRNGYDFRLDGNSDQYFNHTIDNTNTVGGRPILYVRGASGVTYNGSTINAGTIYLVNCTNVGVTGMTPSGSYSGVYLWYTNNSTIENVQTTDNAYGIYLNSSSGNTVQNNTVSSNDTYGIYLSTSNNNKVYGNRFDYNVNPYTSKQASVSNSSGNVFNRLAQEGGGNRWSDWLTPDTDGDGFVDSPYSFSGTADYLPLADTNDRTPPVTTCVLAGTPGTNGWYTSAVQVTLSATDDNTGVKYIQYGYDNEHWQTYNGPEVTFSVSTEGPTTLYYYAVDVALNPEPVQSVSFKIDMTPPVLAMTGIEGDAGEADWYRSDVTVSYSATDAVSGLANAADASFQLTASGEGTAVSTGTYTVYDLAGNSATAGPMTFQIDKTAPVVTETGVAGEAGQADWYHSDVTVSYSATDGLSGLANAADTSFGLTTSGEGDAVSTGTRVVYDLAGNSATAGPRTFKVDLTAPALTRMGTAGDAGQDDWYRTDVIVYFSAADALSGLADAADAGFQLMASGEDSAVSTGTYTVYDLAGNFATAGPLTFKIDKTAPDTVGTPSTAQSGPGWYKTDVEVVWSATDALSGVDPATVPTPSIITGEGAGLWTAASGQVSDLAGNPDAIASVTGINIDRTLPVIEITTPQPYASLTPGTALAFTATDPLSGIFTVTGTLSGGGTTRNVATGYALPSVTGVYWLTVTATDWAGNVASQTVQFEVYDDSGGFVTGGGWFTSPPGAYPANPTLTGKISCSFVSKYDKKIVPNGETQIQFQDANLDFHSTSYTSLLISGTKATFKGTGTINGSGNYSFLIVAIDGTPDSLRIKITDSVTGATVYDNSLGADETSGPTTALEGGSISIKK